MTHQLTDRQLDDYARDGFVLLRNVVSGAAQDAVTALLKRVVDDYVEDLVGTGELTRRYEELSFDRRWAAVRAEVPAARPVVWRRVLIDPAFHRLWSEPGLLGAARSVLGPELRAYHLFNARPREPHDPSQTIEWHQDAFNCDDWAEADSRILTFWIPLVPVDVTSGCLAVVPGSHRDGVLPKVTDEFGITRVRDAPDPDGGTGMAVPMEPGDVLMFNELVLHRSLENVSDRVRWSVDIRFSENEAAHQRKAPGGFRVSSVGAAPESFEEWADKWTAKSGVMRRHLRRLDLYASSLDPAEARDVRRY